MATLNQFSIISDTLGLADSVGTVSGYTKLPPSHLAQDDVADVKKSLVEVVDTLKDGLEEAMAVAVNTGKADSFQAAAALARQITDTLKAFVAFDKQTKVETEQHKEKSSVGNIDDLIKSYQDNKMKLVNG